MLPKAIDTAVMASSYEATKDACSNNGQDTIQRGIRLPKL